MRSIAPAMAAACSAALNTATSLPLSPTGVPTASCVQRSEATRLPRTPVAVRSRLRAVEQHELAVDVGEREVRDGAERRRWPR